MNILGKRSYLPFSRKSDRKKEKSKVSFTHVQNIICSQTQLDGIAHEHTIICRPLFAGHVVGSRPMKRKKHLHPMIIKNVASIVDVSIEDSDTSISHRMKLKWKCVSSHNCQVYLSSCQGCSLQSKVEVKEFDNRRHWLMGSQGDNKIFIHESLTPARRELFYKYNELKKKCKLRYIWSFYGNIFLRKNDTSAPFKVCAEKDQAKWSLMIFSSNCITP